MQEKILKKIITMFAGPDSEKLVDLLYNKKNVNEFLIAKKLNLTINQTRNVLYKLADEGLVGFIRKKDKKKGGWYTYFWTMRVKRAILRYKEEILKELESLNQQVILRENERNFLCENCHIEYNEEEAMANNYTCAECGEVLQLRETKEIATKIKVEIKKLEEELLKLDVEIAEIEKKEGKTIERKIKAEKKKKTEERRKKKIERDKEKKKLEKKMPKVKPKKAPIKKSKKRLKKKKKI